MGIMALPNDHEILIATKNRHKVSELTALLNLALAEGGSPADSVTISIYDWEARNGRPIPEPEEGAKSFIENAALKARYYAEATGFLTLADDSGLSVIALNGEPGVLSARYGGPGLDDAGRCRFLLAKLDGQRDRRAFFTSVLALAKPDGEVIHWTGRIDGLVTEAPHGLNGFGYDPIFYHPPSHKTTAEMTAEEKNTVSHRAVAAAAFLADVDRVRNFLVSNCKNNNNDV